MIAVGMLLLARLSQRFDSTEAETVEALQIVLNHFVCLAKHRNDNAARQRLFEEWYPTILQYQESAKHRALQSYLAPLEQENQRLMGLGNELMEAHHMLRGSLEQELARNVERIMGQKIEQGGEEGMAPMVFKAE